MYIYLFLKNSADIAIYIHTIFLIWYTISYVYIYTCACYDLECVECGCLNLR